MVVRMRHTSSHTKNRRSHHAIRGGMLFVCENCKAMKRGHTACPSCGLYRGRKVIDIVAAAEKKQKKEKAKQAESKK